MGKSDIIMARIRQHLINNTDVFSAADFPEIDLSEKSADQTNVAPRSFSDHLRGLVWSLLSNQKEWWQVAAKTDEIEVLFFGYDKDRVLSMPTAYFEDGVRALKCGNISIKKQMETLPHNIAVLERIETDYGTLDAFMTSDTPHVIAKKLSRTGSVYKLKQIGYALALEYMRNVGVDAAKPDVHVCRILGKDRLGYAKGSPALPEETIDIVSALSSETGLSASRIDSLLWNFCAEGTGICKKTPQCTACPITAYCNYFSPTVAVATKKPNKESCRTKWAKR